LGKFIAKITNFGDFGGPHFKATTVKFGAKVRVQTFDSLSMQNFVKIA